MCLLVFQCLSISSKTNEKRKKHVKQIIVLICDGFVVCSSFFLFVGFPGWLEMASSSTPPPPAKLEIQKCKKYDKQETALKDKTNNWFEWFCLFFHGFSTSSKNNEKQQLQFTPICFFCFSCVVLFFIVFVGGISRLAGGGGVEEDAISSQPGNK